MATNDIAKTPKVGGRYMPPSKRSLGGKVEIVQKLDMNDTNFPSLWTVPKATTPRVQKAGNLSEMIQEKIRLDTLAESLKQTDPWKMTDNELYQEGWVRLSMNSSGGVCMRGFKAPEVVKVSEQVQD
jgi:hypothetical protein